MNLVTQVFTLVAVLFHVVAFVLESFLFHRTDVQTFLLGRPEPAEGVRLWAINQGFYNLFLAAGPAAGLIAHYAGYTDVGRAHLEPKAVAQHDRTERPAARDGSVAIPCLDGAIRRAASSIRIETRNHVTQQQLSAGCGRAGP